MQTRKKVLGIVLNVLLWIFLIFAVLMTIMALTAQSDQDGVPSVGGTCFLTVESDSMSPKFDKGDLIFGKKLTNDEKKSLNIDDVITFHADLDGNGSTELNTHRIVKINKNENGQVVSYVTKGDNEETNKFEDVDPVKWEYVVSKWNGKKVANVGSFLSFLQKPKGFLILIVIPLIIFFLFEVYNLIKLIIEMKTKKTAEVGGNISEEEKKAIEQKAIEEYLRKQAESAPNPQKKDEDKKE